MLCENLIQGKSAFVTGWAVEQCSVAEKRAVELFGENANLGRAAMRGRPDLAFRASAAMFLGYSAVVPEVLVLSGLDWARRRVGNVNQQESDE